MTDGAQTTSANADTLHAIAARENNLFMYMLPALPYVAGDAFGGRSPGAGAIISLTYMQVLLSALMGGNSKWQTFPSIFLIAIAGKTPGDNHTKIQEISALCLDVHALSQIFQRQDHPGGAISAAR